MEPVVEFQYKYISDNTHSPHHSKFGHRCYTFSTTGVIHYDPNSRKHNEKHWCIIDIEKELTRYYREQFKKQFGIILYAPAFDAHVSVLRGAVEYKPKMDESWKYLDKKTVEVAYDSNIYWNERHVWLNTYCADYFDIREFYGVTDWNNKDFSHLTIGKFTP